MLGCLQVPPHEPFVSLLLAWFRQSGRDFPWRRTRDPYRTLVAEFLLQQTAARGVVAVYEAFTLRYPSASAASEATEQDIVRLLKPLGLTHRARTLKRALNTITDIHGGAVPGTLPDLLRLPGVGPYSARAVMCFSYGADLAVVDVNVVRVMDRVFGLQATTTRPHRDWRLWAQVDELIPPGAGRVFNLAVLDLAATICVPRSPKCRDCPVLRVCTFGRSCLTQGLAGAALAA